MSKTFAGGKLRRLREARGLTQVALARELKLSPSYLNQLEHDERPLTARVLQQLTRAFALEAHAFADADDARLIADLRDALTALPPEQRVSPDALRTLATELPELGRAMLALHQRYREASDRAEAFAHSLGDTDRTQRALPAQTPMPYEEVRDFFYARHNYLAELEDAAEQIRSRAKLRVPTLERDLVAHLRERHRVEVSIAVIDAVSARDGAGRSRSDRRDQRGPNRDAQTAHVEASPRTPQRRYDPERRTLTLHPHLAESQRVFQLATQLAFLEAGSLLTQIARGARLTSAETRSLARIGLAGYLAAALVMPYEPFLEQAEAVRYDLDRLGHHFGVGFESVCHRVSTLQRPDARGVPFFFVRVDRAGNISKRQSATDFHFSRVGGTCPLWNVYEAFAQPGSILTQLAQMPDGRTYLWIARTVTSGITRYGAPPKLFAIGLGCDARHAERLVYSKGLDLRDPSAPTPIGAGCKVCERADCAQRAFPPIGKKLVVDENASRFEPYSAK